MRKLILHVVNLFSQVIQLPYFKLPLFLQSLRPTLFRVPEISVESQTMKLKC